MASKLDPKTTRYHFIRYLNVSKGYKFYYPTRGRKIVEALVVKLKNDVCDFTNPQDDENALE